MKTKTKSTNIKKNFVWNLIGSSLYACTSLVFLIIVTRINGIDDAGIFTFGFSFVCIIQVIATYAGRTFQVTERKKEITDSDFLNFRFFTCTAMIVVCFIFCFVKDYEWYKTLCILLLLTYRVIDSYSEAFYGIFQKNNNLFQVGISLTLRSIITVALFLFVDVLTKNLIYSIIAIVLTDIIIFIFYDVIIFKKYKIKFSKISKNSFKYLIAAGFSVFVFTFLMQYITNAPKFAIDNFLSEDIQAIFGIILMPATLMTLCSQLIINPFLYNINKSLENKNYKQFNNLILKICISILLIGILVFIASWLIGIPILNLLYSIKLDDYLFPFLIIVAGSVIYGISTIFMNALIAIRKNTVQMIIYIIITIFSFICANILVEYYGLNGASLCYFASVILLFILYFITFIYQSRKLSCKDL